MKNINAFDLAAQAVRFAEAVQERKQAQEQLDHAYRAWKRVNGINYFIERNTYTWEALLAGTADEYTKVVKAKRRERHHRDRLVSMVGRAQA